MNGGNLNTVNVNVSTGKCLQNSAISNSGRLLYVNFFYLCILQNETTTPFFFIEIALASIFIIAPRNQYLYLRTGVEKSSMYNYLNGITLKVTCKEH